MITSRRALVTLLAWGILAPATTTAQNSLGTSSTEEVEKWLRIDAERHGLDYEEHLSQLRNRLSAMGMSEEEYAVRVKQQMTLGPEELQQMAHDEANALEMKHNPGMPDSLGFKPLAHPEMQMVTGYSSHRDYRLYSTFDRVWLRKPEGTFVVLHTLGRPIQMQEAVLGMAGDRMIAVMRDHENLIVRDDPTDPEADLATRVAARRAARAAREERLMAALSGEEIPQPQVLTVFDLAGDDKRSLRIDSPGSQIVKMWIRSQFGDLLLARRTPVGSVIIERMDLSPDPFSEAAEFTGFVTIPGPFHLIDYDEVTNTFVGSRPMDDGRSVVTQWPVDGSSTPIATRYLDGSCMSHKAFGGRVVALTLHWNAETRREFRRLVSIDLESDTPQHIIKDFEPYNWNPKEIVALDKDEAILLGQLRPRLSGPAALEQPDTPEVGLISAPLP